MSPSRSDYNCRPNRSPTRHTLKPTSLQPQILHTTTLLYTMISTTTKTPTLTLSGAKNQSMKMDGTDPKFGDWRDDLARDGYAVIKGAIPQERALQYADKMYSWLEGLYVDSPLLSKNKAHNSPAILALTAMISPLHTRTSYLLSTRRVCASTMV